MPIFHRRPPGAPFRRRWLGYDCAQVDEFLRRTEADRVRLQEDLAQVEAAMAGNGLERRRELERLARLRREVASCLETSIGALRTATDRLAAAPEDPWAVGEDPPPYEAARFAPPAWLAAVARERLVVAAGAGIVLLLVAVAYQYRPSADEISATTTPAIAHDVESPADAAPARDATAPVLATRAPAASASALEQTDGVVLTLTAKRACWIGTSIDGGQRLERELKANETIMMRAEREVVLRAGDAAALSVLINGRLARPLGAPGEVVTVRISPSSYPGLLAEP